MVKPMKDLKKLQYLNIAIFFVSLAMVIVQLIQPIATIIVTYIALSILGVTIGAQIIYVYFHREQKKIGFFENRMKHWNSIAYRVKKAGELSFAKMPIGILVFDEHQNVQWANDYAKELFLSPLFDRNIKAIDQKIAQKINEKQDKFKIELYGRMLSCLYLETDNILYLTDVTQETAIATKYKKRIPALGIINLDNLSLAFNALDAQEKSLQVSHLIGILSEWAETHGISLTGYSEERYLLITNLETVEALMKTNFDILDAIKDYCLKEKLRLTASIGIACDDIDPMTLMESAVNQLQLALNRGGNQVVVKMQEETFYFGAKSESFEARTEINVRIKTEELKDHILSSKKVIVLSHQDMDADAFGASLLMVKMVRSLGRDANMVFDPKSTDAAVSKIYESIKLEHVNLLDIFITPKEALAQINEDVLLIIVDCQYENILLDEKIYKKAKKVAIIDHHRRNSLAIHQFMFLYTQPSASSSVELIMEMLEYLRLGQIDISGIEATWMLMGVTVDTNNFIYRTTSRTFRVLAKLQIFGAEMSKAQKYLRENFDEFNKKIDILNRLEIVDGKYGIALCDDNIYSRAFLAKVADEVVSVRDIQIAFCIGKLSDSLVGISARSLDDANVQVIMERMGGGGHFNNAATQMKDTTINDAKEQLIRNLRDTQEEGDIFMKVILIKDVKGKGKINDIIDIPAGHANFLIRSNQAIEATVDNIKHLEHEKLLEKQEQEKRLKDMQELKKIVDTSPVKIAVRVGQNGKLFGSVPTKQMVEEFKAQYGIELDKRKIILDKDIDKLGTYKIKIQLHKEVTATLVVYVVEKE